MLGPLKRQLSEVRKGGLPVLREKIKWALRHVALLPVALPLLLIMRALRPFVLVRLGWIWGNRIGHFASDTELYLCERDLGMQPKALDIFFYGNPPSNAQLDRMFRRKIRIIGLTYLPWTVYKLNALIPGGGKHFVRIKGKELYMSRDQDGLFARTSPHLEFTPEEKRLGEEALRELGMPEGRQFVCFHTRDSTYLRAQLPKGDIIYHDYRDSSIHDLLPAMEELARRGYFAVRMGADAEKKLAQANPMIIDYTHSGLRSDFLDIYLGSRCRFFLVSTSGILSVAQIFRRPVVFHNFIPLEHASSWEQNGLLIFKKLRLRKERRFMTFRETLDSGAGRFLKGESYEELGIEIIDNTPEEIMDVVLEMEARLNGTWTTSDEDEELQRQFWSLFGSSKYHNVIHARIGAQYLRQNRELLA
jgi:putative glycosyltransferase (TIGR04372 family)